MPADDDERSGALAFSGLSAFFAEGCANGFRQMGDGALFFRGRGGFLDVIASGGASSGRHDFLL